MTLGVVLDRIAAEVVRAWFCPHLHRIDRPQGFAVHCRCTHCRESWTVPFYAYRDTWKGDVREED